MTYYISRSGQQYGPYSEAELQNMLAQGQIQGTDSAWGEGMAGWVPVLEVLAKPSAPAPQPPQHQPTQYEQPQQPAQPQYQPQPQYQQPQDYKAPQPQYQQPQGGGYAGGAPPIPAYGAPAYGGGYPQQPVAGAVPPGLHWFVVLLLGCIPFFTLIWVFVQAGFVKKIDPQSKATMWFTLWLVSTFAVLGVLGYVLVDLFTTLHIHFEDFSDPRAVQALARLIFEYLQAKTVLLIVCFLCSPLGTICMLVAIFSMRNSIQRYYNSVEPIGLRLSGVMTFFFSILYFQYHFRRIARWKQTGQLT
jgi:hypothetical protein